MKPGPEGGAKTAPKPPSMSPRLSMLSIFSKPVMEVSVAAPKSQSKRSDPP